MDHRVMITSYEEGVAKITEFEFPITIRDTTGLSTDPHYPDLCSGETSTRLKLDWIFDFHGEAAVKVEITGRPNTVAGHKKSQSGSNASEADSSAPV